MKSKIKTIMIDLYNQGYKAGHHDTVEGQYCDIHWSDQLTYHEEEIDQIIDEMIKDGRLAVPE